jgi:MFS family permease
MPTPRFAVFAAFVANGVFFSSWAARVPALAERIGAHEGVLGLTLLGASAGLALTAPLAARVVAAHGARIVMIISVVATAAVLPLLGLATSPPQLGLALFLVGSFNAAFDVSMNVGAVEVLRVLDRPLMPQFHAGFSVGGLLGSLGAAAAAAASWTPLRHFLLVAFLGLLLLAFVGRNLPGATGERHREVVTDHAPVLRRPLLWLLAAIAFCAAVAEGASADWSALFLVNERGTDQAAAAAAYAGFSVTMAVARLLGEPVQRRWGPHRLLAGGALVAFAGLVLVVAVPSAAAGYAGFALAGLGLAFAFPVVMDLAGAAGRRADGTGGERELGLVSTIAYTGLLAGPPLVGGIAHATNLSVALGVVAGVVAATLPAVWLAARAREGERERINA